MGMVRCLFVDDVEEDREYFPEWIQRALKLVASDLTVTVETERNPLKALQSIDAYDLLVSDLMWEERTQQPRGFALIAGARERKPNLAIVAVSDYGALGQLDLALTKGADEQISKQFLRAEGSDLHLFGEKLLAALELRCGHLLGGSPVNLYFEDESLRLRAMVESVGKDNIGRLVKGLIGESCESAVVGCVNQGLSGAVVMAAECLIRPKGGSPFKRTLLIKAARDEGLVRREMVIRKTQGGAFPQAVFPRAWGNGIAASGGWFGLASEFVRGGKTFLDWLTDDRPRSEVIERTLKALVFERGLKEVYEQFEEAKERPVRAIRLALTGTWRAARILLAAEELKELVVAHDPKRGAEDAYDPTLIVRYLEHGMIGEASEGMIGKGIFVCRSHGDLHTKNVVYGSDDGLLWLVDEGNVDQLPWAADIARLVVDLVVAGVDRGPEEHEWAKMNEWLDLSIALIRGEMGGLVAEHEGARCAAWWLRSEVARIFPSYGEEAVSEWQLQLCLVAEFLRAAYRAGEISAPKRVLGLLAGAEGLRQLAATTPWARA